LRIALETIASRQSVKGSFRYVSERRMPQIVRKRSGLNYVRIQSADVNG
jgi:hypothetical protein